MSMQSKKEGHGKLYRTLTYIFLIFLAIISIVPFYNMIIGCTHDNAALATSFQMIPGKHLLDNYHRLQDNVNIWRGLANSVVISVIYTANFYLYWEATYPPIGLQIQSRNKFILDRPCNNDASWTARKLLVTSRK